MRIGVSSRGRSWVSMGPLGWLILGPFLLYIWFVFWAVKLLVLACAWGCRMVARGAGRAIPAGRGPVLAALTALTQAPAVRDLPAAYRAARAPN